MEDLNIISGVIVDTAYKIHSRYGPGLLESVYETLMAKGLHDRGLIVERQRVIRMVLDGVLFEEVFRPDMIVQGAVIVEVKAEEKLSYVCERQLLTYLKITDLRLGLLLNFGAALMKEGIRRVVNKL